MAHPRMRRTSPISRYVVAAGLEALSGDVENVRSGAIRLGIVLSVMTGCVVYSRRFFEETIDEPATASPLLFPETVFNAPASHLAAVLGARDINYTLVGDPGNYLMALAVAGNELLRNEVDGCLVIGAEESDWLIADAFRLFDRSLVLGEGAGALYLRRANDSTSGETVQLDLITDAHLFSRETSRSQAAMRMRDQLTASGPAECLVDGRTGCRRFDHPESSAWRSWLGRVFSPKRILGEGLSAAAAWQCVIAVDHLRRSSDRSAFVSVVGANQQAVGARFSSRYKA
jgi:3-oxoacyl-(acyl-carrier-protein) synthase